MLAAVWLVAGVAKISDLDGMQRSIVAFDLVPFSTTAALAFIIPASEILLGLLLLAGVGVRVAAVGSAVLLGVFMVAIAAAWARGLAIDCGCFGSTGLAPPDPVKGYVTDLVRDSVLLGLALWCVAWPRGRFALIDRIWQPSPTVTVEPDGQPAGDSDSPQDRLS